RDLRSFPTRRSSDLVALTHEVDDQTAERLGETFLEVVLAPAFSTTAREILASKKNLRLLELPEMFAEGPPPWRVRSVAGGLLVQDRKSTRLNSSHVK